MNATVHPLAAEAEPRTVEEAAAEFDALDSRFKALISEQEDLQLAISASRCGGPPIAASDALRARFQRFEGLVATRPRQAEVRVQEIEDELRDLQPKVHVAREHLHQAREARAIAFAAELQPRQRKAVRAIAAALEALSKAVADEQALHAEFNTKMPGFYILPDFGGAWRGALLNQPNSTASQWVRQAAGYLDA